MFLFDANLFLSFNRFVHKKSTNSLTAIKEIHTGWYPHLTTVFQLHHEMSSSKVFHHLAPSSWSSNFSTADITISKHNPFALRLSSFGFSTNQNFFKLLRSLTQHLRHIHHSQAAQFLVTLGFLPSSKLSKLCFISLSSGCQLRLCNYFFPSLVSCVCFVFVILPLFLLVFSACFFS